MAKLVLQLEDGSTRDYPLNKDRITLGRRAANDIVLSNLAVSGEHAAVVTIPPDSFLEDCGSTNGTFANGQQIKRHFLQEGDVIEIGRHKLIYHGGPNEEVAESNAKGESIATGEAGTEVVHATARTSPAVLKILSGPNIGKQIVLERETTSLGKVGKMVIAITRRPHGYFLAQLEGSEPPLVNGKATEGAPYPLFGNDVIEAGGIRMELQVV